MSKEPEPKRKPGRPPKRISMIEASPERVARAMFSAVRPPDPSLRNFNAKWAAPSRS